VPQTILTPLMITRKALDVLHQQGNFLANVNRQYDDRFAQDGAKIGTSLNIRMPSRYSVRTNATLDPQDHVERSTPLNVTSQYGVDLSFTSVELTMQLDDFSERIIEPAIAQLSAQIEGDCFNAAYKLVNNYTNATTDGLMTYRRFQQGGANMTNNLAPQSGRTACMSPESTIEFNDEVKGLFQAQDNIRRQYIEGQMGRTGGFDIYENTLVPNHTSGTLDSAAALTDGAALGNSVTTNAWISQTDLSINGVTADTLKAGDIITIDQIFDVHPETKAVRGKLKTFVVQSDVTLTTAATSYTVTVKPGLIWGTGNAYQNAAIVGSTDTDNHSVTLVGAIGSSFGQDLQFHKDSFVFATADLVDVSKYGAWGARAVKDGISMRIAKQYDINADAVPCRLDILWGFAGLYPELANRHLYELDLL
jgi:hypothetical protein